MISRRLDLDRGLVPFLVDRFAPNPGAQAARQDAYVKSAEQHPSRGHLEDNPVKPIDQQQLGIRSFALDFKRMKGNHGFGIGNDRRHGHCCIGKGFVLRIADPAHSDIGLMLKKFPSRIHCALSQ
ncbi:MAG: hypothetical protein A2X46_00990 [Lentisphaerae bacterium GWF2_57_35]|nr:MAG: hypothetical protein A2X46_00990 [Lentisphaerae bacterium GWF2_57_35]